ncbi:tRNA nucleotidyltransferase [Cronobacter phage vB_CsaM_GAP32]|uniref:Multifunctional tRNA nucleotidyl transferase/2'3'-cyclic phosphodiesterase/2'nucleotidase/phosphatase n=1 Tax=Cronobacter phage vB_CsaM_GAP32 TaxID=1141136 RepID=K4F5Y3_9CAUD|nr:tRNA nucleotidyltransferase [Cronobacter phage vB_CsaM_GAP32]AFC21636.1 multifunctional tRNA nucleotidyl transferase/2'3'-cyclic phosphodiesterase/2'nucleotidase/phosphatase [Cronobacter phage vB_CsaM_GAP32]
MKKYIVGGFVRDKLLGLQPKDKDYVLVGAKPKDISYLESIGYKQVGADFPVYLSPEGDEYALARIERKTGTGYDGFSVETQGVTLEQDLFRRDLTINAIAWDPITKTHIDPYKGKEDLKNKVLKHVSDAFKEDPLRVLRLARFAARYADFKVHKDTDSMVRQMVKNGEINHLTKERVYVEFEKAFSEQKPSIFLKYLKDIGALTVLLPGFDATQKELELIDHIVNTSSEQYRDEFIWSVILSKCTANNDYVVGGIKLPARMVKFSNFIKKHSENLLKFRKKKPEEMVELFSAMNVKNNGGEEFLYKVTEYFIIRREMDNELEDLIVKVFDRYTDAPVGNIEEMVKTGELKSSDIRNYVKDIQLTEVKKMFS